MMICPLWDWRSLRFLPDTKHILHSWSCMAGVQKNNHDVRGKKDCLQVGDVVTLP
jgi:hypothetical protein